MNKDRSGTVDQTSPDIVCPLTVEHVDKQGSVLRKSVYKNATMSLARNEFEDIVLRVIFGTGAPDARYEVRRLDVHKRFAREGKATLDLLADHGVRLLLSNCVPNKLMLFLKTLCLKLRGSGDPSASSVQPRVRLLSRLKPSLTEISPLSEVELNASRRDAQVVGETSTPVRVKRKRMVGAEEQPKRQSLNGQDGSASSSRTLVRSLLNLDLTAEQQSVLNAVAGGQNVFFTGSAGTGKSFLLRKVVRTLAPDVTFVTASTGVAATHIGGTTLHAFAGIGCGSATFEQCLEKASRPTVVQQWRKCRHLIIDEISMVSGGFFAKLEKIARIVRRNERPFGGIQLILCGDFLQLPPVTKDGEKRIFAFQTSAWQRCMQTTIELVQVHRQKDNKFIEILKEIRLGRCSPSVTQILSATSKHRVERNGVLATHLCTHNGEVDSINEEQLQKLEGNVRYFEASDSNPHMSRWLDQQCPVESKLKLKVGAQVMLLKNLDVQRGLVNGARGVVAEMGSGDRSLPVVHFAGGAKIVMKYERWLVRGASGDQLVRQQLPLKLAWAISIHKSQGMTLDCVEMSLARIFECGQAYVALSRAKSLQGLRVLDFDATCVRASSDVLIYYDEISSVKNRIKNTYDVIG